LRPPGLLNSFLKNYLLVRNNYNFVLMFVEIALKSVNASYSQEKRSLLYKFCI
jgi:hypothetical protein